MNKFIKKIFVAFMLLSLVLVTGCTKDGYVADKVSVRGIDIGGVTREEAINTLSALSLGADEKITLVADGEAITITAGEVGAAYNIEATVDYVIEKSGGFFSGLFKKEYPMQVDVSSDMLRTRLAEAETEVVQTTATVTADGIRVTNGSKGFRLDDEKITAAIKAAFGTADGEPIETEFIVTEPDGVKYDEFLSQFGSEYKEAEYVKNDDGTITVTESAPGVVFDKNEAIAIMKQHTREGEAYTIPCQVTLAPATKAELEAALFRDKMATYSSSFATSSANRASNVSLAAKSIDNTIMMPGDVFSFNNALGERTVANGYKTAGAYVGGKTVDQVGGGICQVSSTLYNTVLLSNLEIVERRSHQMTVSYVPIGRDATVNWGTTDFRFKNNTKYPVKIVCEVNGRKLTISFVGTLEDPEMKVKIETNTVNVLEPGEEIVEDPEKEVGYSKTEAGSRGYVVDAVRVVYSGDTEVSREKLTRSRYNPTNNVTTVGTKVVEAPTDAPVVPVAPSDDYQMPPGLIPPEEQVSYNGL